MARTATSATDPLKNAIVAIQREWNGWRTAMVRIAHLEDVHWEQPPGAPRPLLHAMVSCDRLQSGRIDHDCELTPAPHRLLVCVLKSHTSPAVFDALSRRAGTALRFRVPERFRPSRHAHSI